MSLPSIAHQKLLADLESDRSWLESLASQRSQLNEALQANSNGSWIATRGGSFLFFAKAEAEELIAGNLENVEKDILEVCTRVKQVAEDSASS